MADSNKPQAKNELGQLFVDIGIGGLGKTLKGLNSVAATFLLGKNAAMQFAQSVTKPFKEMGNGAVEINKMSKSLGTSTREFQRLYYHLKQFKSENLAGDLQGVMESIQDFNAHGGIPKGWAWVQGMIKGGAQELFEDLTPDLQGALTFMERLRKGMEGMTDTQKVWALREAGRSSDWLHFWERGYNAGDYITYSDEELDAQLKVQEEMERLGMNFSAFVRRFFTEFAPPLINVMSWLSDKIKEASDKNAPKKAADNIKDAAPGAVVGFALGGLPGLAIGAGATKIANKVGRDIQKSNGLYTGTPFGGIGYSPVYSGTTGQAANITIVNNNDIKGNNAEEIANAIIEKSEQDLQYATYQMQNPAQR